MLIARVLSLALLGLHQLGLDLAPAAQTMLARIDFDEALLLPAGPARDTPLTLTYAVVVFAILVQGLTMGRLIRRWH